MSALTSYLLAQGKRRPLQTLRFCTAEALRRVRLQRPLTVNGVAPVSVSNLAGRFRPFAPATAANPVAAAAGTALIEQAERICKGEVEILGQPVCLGPAPDWHADWATGHRWSPEQRTTLLAGPAGTDVKRPWEFARFHHGLRLAQAYWLTRQPRFAHAFAGQVAHWWQHNRCPRGIHWAMPMEVALRAINWIAAAALLADASLEAAFWQRFLASLQQHGRHVFAQREWNPVARSNHYLSCVVGVLFGGILFRDTAEGQQWLAFGRRALADEMLAQVDEDGVAHEGSSGYHLFVTELFLTGALAASQLDSLEHGPNGSSGDLRGQLVRSWGEPFARRLEKMFAFARALVAGRSAPPIWGDCDDGRVLPFCACPAGHAHHLLATAATLFQRTDLAGDHSCSEPHWRLGATSSPATAAATPEGPGTAEAFLHAGFFFFSSPRMRGSIRCGPLGVNSWANHAHCDQLGVELCLDGRPVLVDPGTYLYSGDPEARNALRSTRAHNTPMVEGTEQNRFWPGLLFRMMDDTRSRLLRCHSGNGCFEFAGEHYGYLRLPQRVTVRRDLRLDRAQDTLLVCDTLSGHGSARMEWNFALAPGLTPQHFPAAAPPLAVTGLPPAMEYLSTWRLGPLHMQVWLEGAAVAVPHIEPGWVAPRYGQRVPSCVLQLAGTFPLPVRVAFRFAPPENP